MYQSQLNRARICSIKYSVLRMRHPTKTYPIIMNVLIVFTHPNPASFNHALLERVSTGLKEAGHNIKVKDLYKENFRSYSQCKRFSSITRGYYPP